MTERCFQVCQRWINACRAAASQPEVWTVFAALLSGPEASEKQVAFGWKSSEKWLFS